jgi:hypothetical protein
MRASTSSMAARPAVLSVMRPGEPEERGVEEQVDRERERHRGKRRAAAPRRAARQNHRHRPSAGRRRGSAGPPPRQGRCAAGGGSHRPSPRLPVRHRAASSIDDIGLQREMHRAPFARIWATAAAPPVARPVRISQQAATSDAALEAECAADKDGAVPPGFLDCEGRFADARGRDGKQVERREGTPGKAWGRRCPAVPPSCR